MAAPKFSDDRAARPIGWNRSVLVSEPSWRPIARHSAKSSSVLSSTRGSLLYPWGSPALRRTIAALTPSSSNLRNVLPDTRKCLFIGLRTLERSHVDREAVLHIRLEQSLVSLVDLLDRNNFDIGGNVVLSTEIEHLLGFGYTADRRTGEAATTHDKAECGNREGLVRRSDERDV